MKQYYKKIKEKVLFTENINRTYVFRLLEMAPRLKCCP